MHAYKPVPPIKNSTKFLALFKKRICPACVNSNTPKQYIIVLF